jgi:hypothetical protein
MHPSGKPNPLDPDPAEKGNVLVIADGYDQHGHELLGDVDRWLFDTDAKDGRAIALKKDQLPTAHAERRDLYISHFATCPNRAQHRRG